MKNILISVVVPAYNEENFIASTVKSLQQQDFTGGYEIIVVDNNSTDKTANIVRKLGAKVIFEKHQGIAWARQTGFEHAQGTIIASTDADTIVPKDWLTKIYEEFNKDKKIVGIVGNIELYGSRNIKAATVGFFMPFAKLVSWVLSRKGCFWGANFAIKKTAFNQIHGFNTKLAIGEDLDLGMRAKKVGKIVFKNNLCVTTSARRFEGSRIRELFKFYMFNFFSLIFLNKPFARELKNVRNSHDSNITAKKLKIFSVAAGILVFIILFSMLFVYYDLNPRSILLGKVYWHKNTKEKVIALTFDDGPNEPYTSQIAEILNDNNIKGTFFQLGDNVAYYPEVTKRLASEGHIIANHSYSHLLDLSIEDPATMTSEIQKTQNIITETIGKTPYLFRPPHGFKSPFLLNNVKKNHLVSVAWSDMTNDYYRPGVDKIVKNIVSHARPGGIIVLHDGDKTNHNADRSQSVAALKQIIVELKAQGYRFVTVPELLNLPAYN